MDSMFERCRRLKLHQPGISYRDAKAALIKDITPKEIDMLVDDWMARNWERFSVVETNNQRTVEYIPPRGSPSLVVENKNITRRVVSDSVVVDRKAKIKKVVATTLDNLYKEFAGRIWNTSLPNGVIMRDATGKDLIETGGVYAQIGRDIGPRASVHKNVSTETFFMLVHPDKAKAFKASLAKKSAA